MKMGDWGPDDVTVNCSSKIMPEKYVPLKLLIDDPYSLKSLGGDLPGPFVRNPNSRCWKVLPPFQNKCRHLFWNGGTRNHIKIQSYSFTLLSLYYVMTTEMAW
jgi:hypothetical protein